MCSLLPYDTGICHCAFDIFKNYCVCPYEHISCGIFDKLEQLMIPACPSPIFLFNRGKCLCGDLFCGFDLRNGLYMSFEIYMICICS